MGQPHGLRFRRQQVIDGFIADFYCHAARVVVEVDGPVHEGQQQYDRERDEIMKARGLVLVRVTNDQVMESLPWVLAWITTACAGETSPPSPLSHRARGSRRRTG